jgi:hypothetical protein
MKPVITSRSAGENLSPDLVVAACSRLDAWIEKEDFAGWDPYDALNSPLLRVMTFGSRRLGQLYVQLLKHSPVNLRPLLGVAKGDNPKGMGLFLQSYLRKHQMTADEANRKRVCFFANWLQEHISPGFSGACWGYNFDWPNRGFFAPAGTPTVVNTAFIGLALLEVYRVFANAAESALAQLALTSRQIARSACNFLLKDLNRIRPAADELCFSYTPLDHRFVHNANVMGAWLLAQVHTSTGEPHLARTALAAARYTVRRQLASGAWLYGEGPTDGWVDNFHTGFVLVALSRLAACLNTGEFDEAVERGYAFWKDHMFLPDGIPKYYPGSTYPIDIHCVAQAILTCICLAAHDPEARDLAQRVALWGIRHMQDPEGFFHFQIRRRYRIRTPYMRWSQAWMQRALTEMLWAMGEAG